jgi:protein required for attachment to host cells
MLIPHGTLIALADGGGVALFRNAGREAELVLESVPNPELATHSKDGGRRHRVSARERNRTLLEEDSLAAAITDWLNRQAVENRFDHAFIAAPAKFLGEMRHHYHKALQAKLIGELAKDLRTLRTPEIEKELNLAKPGN